VLHFVDVKFCNLCTETLKAQTFDLPHNTLNTVSSWLSEMPHSNVVASSGLLESFAVSLDKQFPTFQGHYDLSKRLTLCSKETV
jgi:hypothetical protein